MAERSKALRQGRNLFGGVGSNPTLVTLFLAPINGEFDREVCVRIVFCLVSIVFVMFLERTA